MASQALDPDSLLGIELGHYRLLEKIGSGGMGDVYRARDQHLHRDVAIKVLPPGTLADETARKHFHKEALILSQLNHPNIATIHDFDTQRGIDFLVMEYIPGITLSEKLASKALPEKDVLNLGVQLADGLSAAHQRGVVHRDLKPGNLRLTTDGRLKILDFGLAELSLPVSTTASTENLSGKRDIVGTLPYMAPEQIRGDETDARTDVHAAGAVLYEMATGHCPFSEVERSHLASAILMRLPTRPGVWNSELSAGLEQVITKCMEKEPDNRYQSAKELAVDLRRLARARESGQVPEDARVIPNRERELRRRRLLIGCAVVAFALLAIAAYRFAVTRRNFEASRITPSIAVLPFADLSPAKDQEYFSDGLAEELLNSLVKLPGLHVAARTSSFQFKGKNEDLREIGKKLNVNAVLEGSVRKQGQRVRISAQLIQVSDGFHLWSEAYDRDLTDIFAVQEEIARSVANSLKLTLLSDQTLAPRATGIDAYNAYLQGRYFQASLSKDSLEKAIAYHRQAIGLDPKYAPAWAALSRAYNVHAGAYGPVKEYDDARDAGERALQLDPNLAGAHAAIGDVKLYHDWDWAGADAAYEQALALEKGNAEIIERAASLAGTLNRFDEALRLSRRAIELDPLRASAYMVLAFSAWWSGHPDEADAAARKGLEVDPQFPWLRTLLSRSYLTRSRPQEALAEAQNDPAPVFHSQGLALAYHALGRKKESDRALAELVSTYQSTAAFQIAEVYAFRGDRDNAFKWLERAYVQRDGGLAFIKGDPLLAKIEHDPRLAAFLKKMRLTG